MSTRGPLLPNHRACLWGVDTEEMEPGFASVSLSSVMKYGMKFLFAVAGITALILCIGAGPVFAQSYLMQKAVEAEESQIIVDYAVFPTESGDSLRLEVYYQVYNYALEFEPDGDFYSADYVVTVKVFDDEDEPPVAQHRESKDVRVSSLEKAKSTGDFRTAQINFVLPAGKYDLDFLLEDVGTNAILRRDFELDLEAYDSKYPKLSDIELVQATGAVTEERPGGSFAKGDVMVVPSLTHRFSGDEDGRIVFYLEIHQGGDKSEDVVVETSLRKDGRTMVYRDSLTTPLKQLVTRQIREISLGEYVPGQYTLEVSLHGRRYKKLDEKKVDFRIPWTATAVLRHDYDAALDQLEYIAAGDEIDPLRKIKDLDGRLRAIEEFWAKRDPDPATPKNELKAAFYHRVDMANRLFTIMNRDGWRTDRGRILIQFGEPDQIDDYPFDPNRWPYQEWHYYEQGRYRKFVFVDVNEDGDYRLQYPYDGLNQTPDF